MLIAIVPAFNEEKNIEAVINNLRNFVDRVVVVDDGSRDMTVETARQSGAIVLQHEINRGQGAALETGFAYARRLPSKYVITFDADGQFDSADIPRAIAHIEKHNADILFGSRFLCEKSQVPFLKRYFLLPFGRFIDRFFGAPKLTDVHNGFRVFTSKALQAIHITQDRMAHASEIPREAQRQGLRIVEFPVTVRYSEFGQGIFGGIKIVKDLIIGRLV